MLCEKYPRRTETNYCKLNRTSSLYANTQVGFNGLCDENKFRFGVDLVQVSYRLRLSYSLFTVVPIEVFLKY